MVALDKHIIPRAFIRGQKKYDITLTNKTEPWTMEDVWDMEKNYVAMILHPPLPLQCIQSSVLTIPHLAMHIESFARHSPYI